jgi:hypothetical protein
MRYSKNESTGRYENKPAHSKRLAGYCRFLISGCSFIFVLATVFVVRPELGNGVVSGKYFWFYLSTGMIAVLSVVYGLVCKPAVRFRRMDGLILLYGAGTLSVSYSLHSSEAVTKHILLILIILLYFYFRMFLSASKSNRYLLMLFFLATGLAEALWGLR